MVRPTLSNGDVWGDALANASGFPVLDGSDEFGHGEKVIDDWLNDNPDQIKARFYGFYDRVILTVGTGTSLNYTGAPVMLKNGTLVPLSPGSVSIPNGTSQFVFIAATGDTAQVTVATTLPSECIPLGFATASAGTITQLVDLRHQKVEQIRPIGLPASVATHLTGDIKATFRSTLEPGYLLCDGAQYSTSAYPALFAAIGYTFGGSANVFNVPDLRGRTLIGVGQGTGLSNRTLGSTGGSETVTLTVNQLPSHAHNVTEAFHSHGISEPPHNHDVSESPHNHALTDPGHSHLAPNNAPPDGLIFSSGSELKDANYDPPSPTLPSRTGITIAPASTNVSIAPARTGITVRNAKTNVTVNANGGGAAHDNMQPFTAVRYLIKT